MTRRVVAIVSAVVALGACAVYPAAHTPNAVAACLIVAVSAFVAFTLAMDD